MKAPPDSLSTLIDRFDRDRFDMPEGRARVRLHVKGQGAWDLEVQPHRHRVREARPNTPADAEITADAATWRRVGGDLQGGLDAFRAGRLAVRRNMHLGVGFLAATTGDADESSLRFGQIETKLGRVSTMTAGSGRPVVMVHGLGGSKKDFLPTLGALAPNGWRVTAIDLPGFGDSDKPFPAAYDARFFAKWVVATLDALELDRTNLLGHSMGGRVALEVGLRAPDRIDRLVLMNPSMAWLTQRPWTPWLKLVRPELGALQPTPKPFVDGVVRRLVPDSDHHLVAPVIDEFMRAFLTPRGRVAFYAAARNIALERSGPFWERLEDLSPESLFIWGRRDTLVPIGFARHVKRAIPAARHIELECGHAPQIECPRRVNSAIDRFLSGQAQPHGARTRTSPPLTRRAARSA